MPIRVLRVGERKPGSGEFQVSDVTAQAQSAGNSKPRKPEKTESNKPFSSRDQHGRLVASVSGNPLNKLLATLGLTKA